MIFAPGQRVRHLPTGRVGVVSEMNVAGLASYAPSGFIWVEHVGLEGDKWKSCYSAENLERIAEVEAA